MPSAARSNLTYEIDLYVVNAALEALHETSSLNLSINLSTAALNDERWTEMLLYEVVEEDLNPERLIIEITETAAIDDMEKAKRITHQVMNLGFRFAVDDFGAGFSSLYYLRQLPISYVKIDQSLIKYLIHSREEQDFVHALTIMIRVFRKEGIEDSITLDMLKAMGVTLAQGFYLAHPQDKRMIHSYLIAADAL